MKEWLGKKVFTVDHPNDIGTVVALHNNNSFLWVAYPEGVVRDEVFIEKGDFISNTVGNIADYYGYEYDCYTIDEISLAEKYVPNTKIFRELYPEGEVCEKNMLKIIL